MIGDIQHIIVIESLGDEKKTGTELYNDTITRRISIYNRPITHSFHEIDSKVNFIKLFKIILKDINNYQNGLLIHLEMHGAKDRTGLVFNNSEWISWKELIELFRPINIACCNQLFITMATCFGRHLYKGVDPLLKSPYSGYISASSEINSGEIIEKFILLFEELIENGNLVNAFLEMTKTGSNFYYKDSKRTFEDTHKSVRNKMDQDFEFKNNFIESTIKEFTKKGEPIPSKELLEMMIEMALNQAYENHKKAFYFKC